MTKSLIIFGVMLITVLMLNRSQLKIDSGLIMEAVNYLLRNKKHIGNLVLINEYGEILEIERKEIKSGLLKKKIKGFL